MQDYVLGKGRHIVPLSKTKQITRLITHLKVADVMLTVEVGAQTAPAFQPFREHYSIKGMKGIIL
ncbi:hypothetical protein [Rosenbergiella metrosideri]|uniref:hypothetical protein n=1 Tax=Rosenbergiella metrosideri TaxID=2921185 RepID=UPI001F4F61DD|nr:hypothetical protein [Rosenbergiella metrosideri]